MGDFWKGSCGTGGREGPNITHHHPRWYSAGQTNCSPQGVVGTILLHLATSVTHGCGSIQIDRVVTMLRDRELSMRTMFWAAMPGLDPKVV